MKRKVFIGLIIMSVCFIFGGLYITETMNRVVSNLQNIIVLQQVDFQCKSILAQIKEVQSDLRLKNSPRVISLDLFVEQGDAVATNLYRCLDCHHPPPLTTALHELQGQVEIYQEKLNKVYTLRQQGQQVLLASASDSAFKAGEDLQNDLQSLFRETDGNITSRMASARVSIEGSRTLLFCLITIGPLIILVAYFYFFDRFTRGVSTLTTAIQEIQSGNLEYRIKEKLDTEFRHMARAFNNMGMSLKDQCQRVESMQKRYRLLFESAGDAIFIMEAEGPEPGRIVSANRAAADMHGYTVEELLNMNIKEIDTPESATQVPARLKRILQGEWIKFPVTHFRKDGSQFPLDVSAGLLEYDNHKYVLAFDRDISERVKAEEALQRTEQLAVVGEMAAGLAHEIKNPLAGIKVSIEILAADLELTQEDKEVFLRVVQEVNRIESLLKNLLTYAKPSKPAISTVDLKRLLNTSIKNAEVTLQSPNYFGEKKKEIEFVTDFAEDLPHIAGDLHQLQQIVLNILLNAIEAIADSGTITIKTIVTQAGVQLIIADTGRGFDEQGLQKVFQPFYTTKPKGNGLGLAITKRLIEQHNGSIEMISHKGQGAVFIITLPTEQH